jgi:Lon protease-like protein
VLASTVVPLPRLIPLFPLPNVVLFPQVLLPLHIFEPRYREMVKDVAAGDELIGMILLRGPEDIAEPGRDVFTVGCAGRMIRKVDLPDGRSNILLQGVREFVPREQTFDRPYRVAAVDWMPAPPKGFRLDPTLKRTLLERIRQFLGEKQEEMRILNDPTVSDEMLVDLFAFALDFPVAEKQSLLEVQGLESRAERLIDTLEFHALEREFSPGIEQAKFRVQ